tara:strand:- start:205 stop:1149 length:945 start_codon:yes stop_codon:yes gene_type:complete
LSSEDQSFSLDPAGPEHNVKRIDEITKGSVAAGMTFPDGTPVFSFVEFSITDLCNRVCVFCPRSDPSVYPNNNEEMSLDLYEKILAELSSIGWQGLLSFSGYGEPLLHTRLIDFVRVTKEHLPTSILEMVTNGDRLTAETCRTLFDSGMDCVKVSLYDGPHQIEPFETMRNELELSEDQFIIRHRFLGPEDYYGLILTNRAGTVDFDALEMSPLAEPKNQPCYFPFYKVMIDYDGRVLLCSHDWNKKLCAGDLNEVSLEEAWTGRVMMKVRQKLAGRSRSFSPCSACDVDGTMNGGQAFEQWKRQVASTEGKDV